jgi:hypothetical protein
MRNQILATVVMLTLPVAFARAAPFDPTRVPADARYVGHVDMDALRPTHLWDEINDRLVGNEAFGAKMGLFEQGSGMRFPRDLHDVTIYGKDAGDTNAVTLVHARMNRDQFMAALVNFAPNAAADSLGKYDTVSWDDGDRKMFATFHDESTLIFARSEANLGWALDAIDGKVPHVAPTDRLAAGAAKPPAGAPAVLAYAATVEPADLMGQASKRPVNPLLKQVDGGWLTIVERPATASTRPTTGPATQPASDDVAVHVVVMAQTADGANQLVSGGNGLRFMVGMAATSKTADPNLKFIAGVLGRAVLAQDGKTATADLSAGIDQLAAAADAAIKARADRDGDKPGDK